MRASNVQKCVDLVVGIPDCTVAGFNEMGGRNMGALLKPHGWVALQGAQGDRARAPIGYDPAEWELVDWGVRWLSKRNVTTKVGKLIVPSGNRWATYGVLRNKRTGEVVAFVAYHSIAHMNVGGHFGWTGKGPRALLALRNKIANPAIAVYQDGQRGLAALIRELDARPDVDRVVPTGDWNFDAFADLRAIAAGKGEPYGPHLTMRRNNVTTIYDAGALTTGTAGKRGIDYIGTT